MQKIDSSTFLEQLLNERKDEKNYKNPYMLLLKNNLILLIDSDRSFTSETTKVGVDDINIKHFKNGLYELNINAEKNEIFNKLVTFLNSFDLVIMPKKN